MGRIDKVDKYFKGTPQMARLKGELVEEKEPQEFAPDYEDITLNPYKTPPNNLTSKDKTTGKKG